MPNFRALVLALALALALVNQLGPATAQVAVSPELTIAKKATLIDGGQSALLLVSAACPVGTEIVEAFVYVNQGGNSTTFGAVSVPCDGTPHTVTVTVTALDFLLEKGKASVSGYMLLSSGESISPVQRIMLRR